LKIDSSGFANGCNDSAIVPEAVTPVLQTGSGTTITTGPTGSNPLVVSNNPSTVETNICTPVGESEIIAGRSDLIIYPNPFSSSTTIVLNSELRIQNAELKLYDTFGREILVSRLQFPISLLERNNLKRGIYFYKVTGDKEAGAKEIIGTGKIIIE